MARTYKDSALVIDRLERKFRRKVRSLSQKAIEEERFSPFLEYLYDDEEDDQGGTNHSHMNRHSQSNVFFRNY